MPHKALAAGAKARLAAGGERYYRLGNRHHQREQFDLAIAAYQKAVELNPQDADSWNNLGKTFKELNRLDEALAAYRRAVRLREDFAVAHCNGAIALLAAGRFGEGFREYEWRWRLFTPRGFTQPAWDGSPIPGKTLFIHAEQGLGDSVQFVRYLQIARRRAGRVHLECQAPLKALFNDSRCADSVIAVGEHVPPFDYYLPLMSLARVLGGPFAPEPVALANAGSSRLPPTPRSERQERADGTTREQVAVPYLRAPAPAQPLVGTAGHFKVGLVWAGNSSHQADSARSLPLEKLAPVLRIPGVTFFSYQLSVPPGDLPTFRSHPNLADLGPQLKDFSNTAALVNQMDLLITVDSAVGHLAGALGKPTCLLLQHSPDWRWLLNRTDTPWYPTMRLFRQRTRGDWSAPVAEAAAALNSWLGGGNLAASRPWPSPPGQPAR